MHTVYQGRVTIAQPIIAFVPNGESSCVYCSTERFLYSLLQSTYILDMYWYINTD